MCSCVLYISSSCMLVSRDDLGVQGFKSYR